MLFLIGADPQIVFHCATQTTNYSQDILRDADGNPLSAGIARNGDGDLITLGYYSEATSDSLANHFSGTWIPLTAGTRIGDSSTGYGFNDGMFSFTSTFTRNSDIVDIFPYEPAYFQLLSSHVISSSLPATGTPLCIRFYDSPELTSTTKFNAVTGPDWLWPNFSSGIPVNFYLKISKGSPPGNSKWKYGSTLQFPNDSFRTTETIEYVPTLYDLTVNYSSGGTVSDVNASYPEDSSVELLAIPDPHMEFVGWLGAGVSDPLFPNTVVFMTEDRNVTAIFQPKLYKLQISGGTGNVTGAGEYSYGKFVDISATPTLGFEFSNWEGPAIDNNMSDSTRVQILQDTHLKAIFSPKQHIFTVSVNNPAFGNAQIIQNGPFRNGSFYDIFAQPNSGYNFSHWSSTNDALYMLESNTSVTTKVNLLDDAVLFANFYELQYKLEVMMGAGGDSVSPTTANYGVNQIIPIEAVPSEGYKFTKWYDPGGIINDPYNSSTDVNMSKANGDQTILANFTRKDYDISLSAGIGGNVIINIPNGPWYHFESYTIQAIPNPGYKFVSWNGNQDSMDSLLKDNNFSTNQITVTKDVTLNAHFTPENYFISVSSAEGGQASGGGQYLIENKPQITATADTGWEFSHWEGNETFLSNLSSNTSPNTIVDLTDAPPSMAFEAVFKRSFYTLSVQSSDGGSINGKSSFKMDVESGTEISLQAFPQKGWRFDNWWGLDQSLSYDSIIDFVINSNLEVEATFIKNSYTLDIGQSTFGESSGAGTYAFDDTVQISTTPKEGYRFEEWTGDIEYLQSSISANTFVKIPDSNISLMPVFKVIPIEISTLVVGSGSVTGSGPYPPNELFFLEAVGDSPTKLAPRGFELLQWSWTNSQGVQLHSTDNPLVLSSQEDLLIEAEFYAIPPEEVELNINSMPSDGGTTYDAPDQRTWNVDTDTIDRNVTALAQKGYYFKGWSINPDTGFHPSWRHSQIVVSPEDDSNLTAHFEQTTHDFNLLFDKSQGTVSNFQKSYLHEETFNLKATPNAHYEFDGWTVTKGNSFTVSLGKSSIDEQLDTIYINNKETPKLFLYRGFIYHFDVSLGNGFQFYLSSKLDVSIPFEAEYLVGVENSRPRQGILKFVVPQSAPDQLYYKLSQESSLFGIIEIIDFNLDEIISFPNESSISPTLRTDLELSANFTSTEYQVVVTAGEGGSVQSVSSKFIHKDEVLLVATPNEHFEFLRWEGSNHIAEPTSSSTKLTVSESTNIRAVFTPVLYPLNIKAEPEGTASFKTTDNLLAFPFGTKINIEAIPLKGFRFMGWKGEVLDSSKIETSLVIGVNNEVVATIATEPLNIKLETIVLDHEGKVSNTLEGGSTTGTTIVQKNSTYPYVASKNEGFDFLGWFDENQNIISNLEEASLSFTKSTSLYAKFQLKTFRLDITISPKYFGNLWWDELITLEDLNYTFPYNHQVSLLAKPLGKNTFVGWELSSDSTYKLKGSEISFSLQKDTLLTARFAPPAKPFLRINIFPEESGSVLGEGPRSSTGAHYIFATPNSGYVFSHWNGNTIHDNKSSDTHVEFDQNTTITAFFEKTTSTTVADVIQSDPPEFVLEVFSSDKNHGSTNPFGTNTYTNGQISILAEPKPGFIFSHWNGDDILDNDKASTFINLSKNTSIAAIFIPSSSQQKYVNVEKVTKTFDHHEEELLTNQEGGTIIGSSSFAVGQEPIFKSYSYSGFEFVKWENELGQILSTAPEIKFDSQTDFSLIAVFKKKSYNLTLATQPDQNGQIYIEGIGNISNLSKRFAHGHIINMTANDLPNYKFLSWSIDELNIENPQERNLEFKISKDLRVVANYFPLNSLKLTTEVSPLKSGWIIGGGEFSYNANHLIFAKANPGYKFSMWEGSQIIDKGSSQTSINLDQDLSIRAIFVPDISYPSGEDQSNPGLYSLTVKSNDKAFGRAYGSGVYGTGWIPIEALPEKNYEFSHWQGEGLEDSLSPKTNLFIDDETEVTAYFQKKMLFSDSKINLNGWKESNWFGTYWNRHPEKWAYHYDLGWVFAQEIVSSSYWVWIHTLNDWYWIDKITYPYMYHPQSRSWMFVLVPNPNPIDGIIVYEFKNNKWIKEN